MTTQFKLPPLGEEVEDGEILSVLVSEGDEIDEEQTVVEVETDKATLEVPCSLAGTVTEVHVSEGDTIKVGEPLISLDTSDQEASTKRSSAKGNGSAGKRDGSKQKREQQQEGEESRREHTDGRPSEEDKDEEPADHDRQDERPEEPGENGQDETKRPSERPRSDGPDASKDRKEEKAQESKDKSRQADDRRPGVDSHPEAIPAPPIVRKLARELGIDLEVVANEQPGARLTRDHVKAFVRKRMQKRDSLVSGEEAKGRSPQELPDMSKWGPVDRVPLSRLEQSAARRLEAAWTGPHVTHYDLADIDALESMRDRFDQRRDDGEPKLTLTALLIKAVVHALRKYPKFNASLDSGSDELIIKHYYHIGVAVDTERGLVVPVLRDCDEKSILEIATELEELAQRTRDRKIKVEELRGSSFTVSNVGGIGGTSFAPIVNYPNVAILGVARVREELVLRNGAPYGRVVLPLCLSFDHRAVNGADAARFTRYLSELLIEPEQFMVRG